MSTWSTLETEALMSQSGWVRKLAFQLVRDPHLADDLTQETYLRALEKRPSADQSLRGWLLTVLRNLSRQGQRGAARRAAREERAAAPETGPSTLELVERVERHRSVVDALMALREPYRSTLIRRFFENLTPTEIAAKSGQPVSTIKTQLARGLELLRANLERQLGGRTDRWLLALVPFRSDWCSGASASSTAIGAFIVSTQIKFIAVTIAALAAGTYALTRPDRAQADSVPLEPATQTDEVRLQASDLGLDGPGADTGARMQVADAAPVAGGTSVSRAAPSIAPRSVHVQGWVYGADGGPLAGIDLVAENGAEKSESATTRSGAAGRFELELVRRAGTIRCADPGRVTLYSGRVSARHERAQPVVVVARHRPLAGRVVDESGRGIEGASIDFHLPFGFRSRFGAVMDYSDEVRLATSSGPDGAFGLERAGAVNGATLSIHARGYTGSQLPVPGFADSSMTIVLKRPAVLEGMLSGRVIDDNGQGVPEARVSLGLEGTLADAGGFFYFEMRGEESPNRRLPAAPKRLLAVKEGFQVGRLVVELDPTTGLALWPGEITIVLAGQPETITGRVLDLTGQAIPGMQVWVANTTMFADDPRGGPLVLESMLAGRPEDRWLRSESNERGEFELTGLLAQSYRLSTMDPLTLLTMTSEPIEAGSRGVELVLDRRELFERVGGRVVDHVGRPVIGATVHGMADSFSLRHGENTLGTEHSSTPPVVTDSRGAFELENVPKDLVYLRIDGEGILPMEYGRRHEGGLLDLGRGRPREFEIVVSRRMHLRVLLDDPVEADALSILDEAGQRVSINVMRGTSRSESRRVILVGGVSDGLTVSDMARTLVLLSGGKEVRRLPLQLAPGEMNEIRP